MKPTKFLLLCLKRQFYNLIRETFMKQALRVLLVTALVAPLFMLTACCGTTCCPEKCPEKCEVDKCGMPCDSRK